MLIGGFGVVYGAIIQRNGNQEPVAVKTVKGAFTMLHAYYYLHYEIGLACNDHKMITTKSTERFTKFILNDAITGLFDHGLSKYRLY